MTRAVSDYIGRLLTGLTFGKRGAPVYARVYDKTREADPDAMIREKWSSALGRPLPEGAQVWRVEFELRLEFLRTLAISGEHLSTDPRVVLADHLDAIWHHLTADWLVLRDPRSASRLTRCRPQAWWRKLSEARTLGQADQDPPALQRRKRSSDDPDPLLLQLAGVLAAFGARRRDQTLGGCLQALEDHMRRGDGDARFAAAVERARLRMPLAAKSRRAAEGRVVEGPHLPPLPPDHESWLEAA